MAKKKLRKPKEVHVIRRVEDIQNMLIDGWFRRDIVSYCTAEWNVKTPTVDKYIRQAKEKILKQAEKRQTFNFSKAQARLEDLYKKILKQAITPKHELSTKIL